MIGSASLAHTLYLHLRAIISTLVAGCFLRLASTFRRHSFVSTQSGIPMHWYSCCCSWISSLCLSVEHVAAVERLVETPYSKLKAQ